MNEKYSRPIQRAAGVTAEGTTKEIGNPSDDMKGHIISRENFLGIQTDYTGVDVIIIDDTSKSP